MIELLPRWNYPDSTPAFYDNESLTAIQASAKVYGKMNELVKEYNKFADECNKKISEFEYSTIEELNTFEASMRQEFQDFIDAIENHIRVHEANINEEIKDVLNQGLTEGSITITGVYDESSESLNLTLGGSIT